MGFKLNYCYTIILLAVMAFASPVKASTDKPILIEMFSSITCPSDPQVQRDLYKILQEHPNAVLVNCRTGGTIKSNKADKVEKFRQKFCDTRSAQYFLKLNMFMLKSPLIVVDGKYNADTSDIKTALNMAQSIDDVKNLSLSIEKNTLHIEIPELGNAVQKGEIYLYTYTPTHEITFKPDQPFIDDNDKSQFPKSNPFEGSAQPYTDFYIRPVIGIERLAEWGGKEKKISYPLPITYDFSEKPENLSYVVVLTAGDNPGDIVAVGELKSKAEIEAKAPSPKN